MEAVAAASAIAGLLSFGYDLVKELVAYGESVRNAPTEVADISIQVLSTCDILEDYHTIFGIDQDGRENRGQGFFTIEALIRIRRSADRCTIVFQELRKEFRVACSMTEQVHPHHPPQFKASDRAQWHFKKPRIISLIEVLDKLKADLHARLLILYISCATQERNLQIHISGINGSTISELTSRAAALYNYSQQNRELTSLPNSELENHTMPAPHPGGDFSQPNTQPSTPTAIRPTTLITAPAHISSDTVGGTRRKRSGAAILDRLVVTCQEFAICVTWIICCPCMLWFRYRASYELSDSATHEESSGLTLTPATWAEGPNPELREKARRLLNDGIGAVSEKYHIPETESQALVDSLISQWIVLPTESTTNEAAFINETELTVEG